MSYVSEVLADNPIVFWRLDEPSGTVARDYLGVPANNGTYNGTITRSVPGATSDGNTAIRKGSGTGDYVSASVAAVNTTAAASVTAEFWMKWDGTVGGNPFVFPNDVLDGHYGIWLNVGVGFGFNSYNNDVFGLLFGDIIIPQRWLHITAVFVNGTITSNKIYVNGEPKVLTYLQSGPGPVQTCNNLVYIGRNVTAQLAFPGDLDDVSIYNSELSAARILAHYRAGVTDVPVYALGHTGRSGSW